MFYHYAMFLEKLKPKFFLFENVKGLLSIDKGKTFETIYDILSSKGYEIKYKVLNAYDYKVPQKRERLILIGIRKDLINKVNFNFPLKIEEKIELKDILFNVPESLGSKYSKEKEEIFKLVPPGTIEKIYQKK
ncbi:DNA (cytosine-5-)-methyltransferase [Mycoplasmopsis felis]|uniref:DNA cytosine methyltransferase n=1 Tax=Mycoplasmopsis felis TaxID=33923 RepID=UPI002FEEED28